MPQSHRAAHWDAACARGDAACSWYQPQPVMSLRMLEAAGVTAADSLIEVGGGASGLAGTLLDRGFGDVTVLDIAPRRDRVGTGSAARARRPCTG